MLSKDPNIQTEHLGQLLAFDTAEQLRPDDEPWSRLSAGELSLEEALSLAKQQDPTRDDEELWQIAQLFLPPTAERREEERTAVLRAFDEEEEPMEPGDASVVSLSSRRRRIATTAGLAAAAAAAVILALPHEGSEGTIEVPPETIALPGYQLQLESWRGPHLELKPDSATASEQCAEVHRDHHLEVDLRPETAVEHEIGVVAWAVSRDGGTALDLELVATIEANGFIEIRQPVSALGLTTGEWVISFAVGPRATLDAIPRPKPGQRRDVIVLQRTVCVVK